MINGYGCGFLCPNSLQQTPATGGRQEAQRSITFNRAKADCNQNLQNGCPQKTSQYLANFTWFVLLNS
ncbi:hypothetical protein C7N43_03515 [Sphingobacteriales bacterium UPWRP_1]|nr:hypothetical protein BVG80_07925 [Sphingobacteriales bacterium TSM_CSM]PSJ78415.1 hypothetical protein C7N43_03515 [Sphingobacteriales bacterium UPWRP_1]